jgi:type II secretory pathway predicted ATPase ExeA
MYTNHWRLNHRPFDNDFDRRFYYPSEVHQATLLKLRYAIEHRRGAALLAGPSGLGKTLLVRALQEDLPEAYGPLVHLGFPQMPPAELLALLANALTGETAGGSAIHTNVQRIEQALVRNAEQHRHTVVVLDEAHLLRDTGGLETVRLLLNLETNWTLLLVAQTALLPALERMPELEERLSVKCLLRRFTLEETISYIHHRMLTAGTVELHAVFDPAALERIHQLTEGTPRRINRLCDLCLLIGYAEDVSRVTAPHVEAVAGELVTAASVTRRAA